MRTLVLILFANICLAHALASGQEPSPHFQRQAAYSGLWPFFSSEELEDGSRKWTSLFGAFRAESEPDGDWHHHLLPFYCASRLEEGSERQLHLFPLLYWSRRRPDASYTTILPLWHRWSSGNSSHWLLWPLLHAAKEPSSGLFRIPTLFRHGNWSEGTSRQRLGVPLLFELLEHAREPNREAWTFANFFNFADETHSGLAVAKHSSEPGGFWHSHLFPLYYAGKPREDSKYFHTPLVGMWSSSSDEKGLVLPALFSWGLTRENGFGVHAFLLAHAWRYPDRHGTILVPFYWDTASREGARRARFYSLLYGTRVNENEGKRDYFLPLLLSHYGTSPDGHALDVFWPLGHYSRVGETSYALRALPFYYRYENEQERGQGIALWPYHFHEDLQTATRSHWIFFPLGFWETSPQGLLGWAVPGFFRRREHTPDRSVSTTVVLPSYFSHTEDGRWETKDAGSHEWSSRQTHLWPLFGYGSTRKKHEWPEANADKVVRAGGSREDSKRVYSTLWPFFQVERRVDSEQPDNVETEIHSPWPLVQYSMDASSFAFHVRPALTFGSAMDRDHLRLFPLLSVESGAGAEGGFAHWISLVQWFQSNAEQRFHLFPALFYWSETENRRRAAALLHLFGYKSTPEGGWMCLLPLVYSRWSEHDSSFGLFPLYYQRHSGSEPMNRWSLARFFFLWSRLQSAEESHWSILWKLAESTRSSSGDHELRVLHRFFLYRSVQGQWELLLNPLFHRAVDERTGQRRFSILKFLFQLDTEGGESTARVLFIPVWRSGPSSDQLAK